MTISGSILASCKKCRCKFYWHSEDMPYVDAEYIGTCSECIKNIKHKCVNEEDVEE